LRTVLQSQERVWKVEARGVTGTVVDKEIVVRGVVVNIKVTIKTGYVAKSSFREDRYDIWSNRALAVTIGGQNAVNRTSAPTDVTDLEKKVGKGMGKKR